MKYLDQVENYTETDFGTKLFHTSGSEKVLKNDFLKSLKRDLN